MCYLLMSTSHIQQCITNSRDGLSILFFSLLFLICYNILCSIFCSKLTNLLIVFANISVYVILSLLTALLEHIDLNKLLQNCVWLFYFSISTNTRRNTVSQNLPPKIYLFCLHFAQIYYSNNFAGIIDTSLINSYVRIAWMLAVKNNASKFLSIIWKLKSIFEVMHLLHLKFTILPVYFQWSFQLSISRIARPPVGVADTSLLRSWHMQVL